MLTMKILTVGRISEFLGEILQNMNAKNRHDFVRCDSLVACNCCGDLKTKNQRSLK